MPKVALIEIGGGHEECLYSQIVFLQSSGYETTLICDPEVQQRLKPFKIQIPAECFHIDHSGKLPLLKSLWKIRNFIIAQGFDTVVFNSAHGNTIKYLMLFPFPHTVRFVGVMHGINKLQGSFTQKLISLRVKRYYLLNDYLVDNLPLIHYDKKLSFSSFYPIDFPDFNTKSPLEKPDNEFWICIPGQIEYKRRDYESLIKAFALVDNKQGFKFLLLGSHAHKDGNGAALQQLIDFYNLGEYFYFSGFLDYPTFHALVKQSDVVMPLIHPGNESYIKYLKFQITGGYNLAFAYKKPLVMLDEFRQYADFKENAVFYNLNNLAEVLASLPEAVERLLPFTYKQQKWGLDYRRKQYINFLAMS